MMLALAPLVGGAQVPVPADTLTQARSLRDAGRLEGARRLLHHYVASHPENEEAARLLGETAYWMHDHAAARAAFESALVRHPGSVELRLSYGRMLVETGDEDGARVVLVPLAGTRASRGRAETWLGMAAYWAGDRVGARRAFEAALAADPANVDARTALMEIYRATAPKVEIAAHGLHDDQPLDRTSIRIAARAFVTPSIGISARIEPTRLVPGEAPATVLTLMEGAVAASIPAIRTEIEVAGGTVARETSSEWTARLGAALRGKGGFFLRARAERSPYLNTIASVPTPIMKETLGATLEWTHRRGWMAEAAVAQDRFPDANRIASEHLWILAPIAGSGGTRLHVGYAFSGQHADESRYAIVTREATGPGAASVTGEYVPYYTPLDLQSHSALASIILRVGSRVTVRAGGGYGTATETAESVERRTAGPFQPATYVIVQAPRTFSPWNARASVDAAIGELLTVTAAAETMRTAFYRAATIRLGVSQTFRTPSLRRLSSK